MKTIRKITVAMNAISPEKMTSNKIIMFIICSVVSDQY